MGKEIVYCGGCGKSLHEDDFSKGKAHHTDHRPFCTDCKPMTENRTPPHQTSSRLAALTKTSSGRYAPASAPSTRRRRADESDSSRTPLLIGAALIAAALLILIAFVLSSGNRSAELPPADPMPPPPHSRTPPASPKPIANPPVSAPVDPDRAAAAIRDLEAFSISSDNAVAILQRCDEVRPMVQGTIHEARLKAIEERARETRRTRQLAASLEEVSKLRALDPHYERREEVLRLLRATLSIAGPRRPEVEEIIRKYEKDAQTLVANPPPAPLPPSPPVGPALGPYEIDDTGCINHWLVLGPFGNRAHREGLYDNDLLNSEASHLPAAGLEVATRESTRVRWTPVTVTDGRVFLRKIDELGLSSKPEAPAIVYAACWVAVERDMEIKFRVLGEMGYYLKLDQQRLRNNSPGQLFSGNEDVFHVKLTQGPHLLLFKVATIGEPFGVRLRLTTLAGQRTPGLKIWNQPPITRKVLFSESFNEGPGKFQNGQQADGGVEGTKAYLIHQKAAWVENVFPKPVTSETTVRFKVKPLFDMKAFEVMMWSPAHKNNAWYHVRDLKKGEWNVVEFKVGALRTGWKNDGPSLEGDTPYNIRFAIDDAVPDARALVDDFELLE